MLCNAARSETSAVSAMLLLPSWATWSSHVAAGPGLDGSCAFRFALQPTVDVFHGMCNDNSGHGTPFRAVGNGSRSADRTTPNRSLEERSPARRAGWYGAPVYRAWGEKRVVGEPLLRQPPRSRTCSDDVAGARVSRRGRIACIHEAFGHAHARSCKRPPAPPKSAKQPCAAFATLTANLRARFDGFAKYRD